MNMLGAVARGVGGAVFGSRDGPDEAAAVEELLGRVAEGVLGEDRREALQLLRDRLAHNPAAQLAVGERGLPVLAGVLREERGDTDFLRTALECLVLALAPGSQGADAAQEAPAGAINAELFAREPGNIALLLGLLDDEPAGVADFYVRYHTVQLLTACAMASSYRLQEAILASPVGVSRLMDMLTDREAIRNEALLLLIGLTRANAEIQKIAAFEGAFDQLLNIIREEGGAGGGIIVQDCLELTNNLLRANAANQRMFREMGHLGRLPGLLQPPGGGRRRLGRQVAANLLCALETVMLLVSAAPPGAQAKDEAAVREAEAQRGANQTALLGAGALDGALALALADGGVASPGVRAQALRCVAQLVARTPAAQEALMGASVPYAGSPLPALQAILGVALHSASATERSAAEGALRAFCRGNPDGQATLACTIMPAGDADDAAAGGSGGGAPGTFGGVLVRALVGGAGRAGLQGSARAAGVLSHLLADNPAAKQRVLTIPLTIPASATAPPQLLMPRCIAYLTSALSGDSGPAERYAAAVLLRTLVTWLHTSPPACAALLAAPVHVPFLIDVAAGRAGGGDAVVAGLAALLLGACLAFAQPAAPKVLLGGIIGKGCQA